jgi:hypothetical protein
MQQRRRKWGISLKAKAAGIIELGVGSTLGSGGDPTRLTPVRRRERIGMGDRKEEPLWPG